MGEPSDPVRARELERRRENELKDLEVEATHGQRPLEGLSGAPTTWTQQQDEAAAQAAHGHDEAESVRRSEEQVPPAPSDRTLPD